MRNLQHAVVYGKPLQRECAAVAEGLRALGAAVTWRNHGYPLENSDFYSETDVAVTFGQRVHSADIAERYRQAGIPVLTVDLPPIRDNGLDETQRALWLNDVNWMPNGPHPPDRLERLHLKFRELRDGSRAVLVCGQTDDDAAHGMGAVEMREWARSTLAAVDEFHPVTWRPHPKNAFRVDGFEPDHSEDPLADPWHAVVTINSTMGLSAIIAGIPVFCSPSCFYAEIGNTSLVGLGDPYFPDIGHLMRYFSSLAYVQWTFDELASGEAVEFVLEQSGITRDKRPSMAA